MQEKLVSQNIKYSKLKTVLSPGNKGDIAFVFDFTKIKASFYGEYILNLLIPKLHNNDFCFLHSDYCNYSASLLEKTLKLNI